MNPSTPDEQERAALFAVGALPPAEADPFDFATAAEFTPAVAALAADVPPCDPPVGLKATLLSKLDDPRAADKAAARAFTGIDFAFDDPIAYKPTPFPGITMRLLTLDRDRNRFSALFRIAPGASYPSHPHDGPEECVVLSGEVRVGGVRLRAGDYQRAIPGSTHIEQRTDTGAVVFITGPISLLHA
jgi:hypothetical protein